MNFWRAVEILNKRKWLIVLSVLVATALTFGATRLTSSRYVATVRFLTDTSLSTGINSGSASQPGGETGRGAARNQAAIYAAVARRDNVIRDVVEEARKNSKLPVNLLDEDELDAVLASNTDFDSISPRLYRLQLTDRNPERASYLANALAERFVVENQNLSTQQAQKVVNLLAEQLKKTERALADARRHHDAYRSRHKIANNRNTNLELALARLTAARQRRDEIQRNIAEAKARLQLIESSETKNVTTPTPEAPGENPVIAQIEADLKDAEQKVHELEEQYTESSPKLQAAIADREAIKERLAQEKSAPFSAPASGNEATSQNLAPSLQLRQEIAGSEGELQFVERTIKSASTELDSYKDFDSPLITLAAKISEKDAERVGIASRLNRARMEVDALTKQNPITVIERVSGINPVVNTTAGRTQKLLLMAALGALVCACALIVALDSIDRRLKTVSQAEIVLPARVVAAIPQPMGPVTYSTLARVTELQPMSLHSEAYRFLASHLLRVHNPGLKALMVLSAKAEQGSTTTITNLGISLAQAGQRVILVDANIRTAELHQVFDLPNDVGFINLLQTPDTMLDQVMHSTSTPNLHVIPSGPTPENPWSLFRSPNLAVVARQLRDRADYVIYDTPSALMFTDALNIASVADAAFLCVRALEPLTGGEERIVELLKEANVPVLGSVLNDVPASVIEGYDNYQHYYMTIANQSVPTLASSSHQMPERDKELAWIEMTKEPEHHNDRDT